MDYLGYVSIGLSSLYRSSGCVVKSSFSLLLYYSGLYPGKTSVMYTFALCGTVVVCYKLCGAWYFDQSGAVWYGHQSEVRYCDSVDQLISEGRNLTPFLFWQTQCFFVHPIQNGI